MTKSDKIKILKEIYNETFSEIGKQSILYAIKCCEIEKALPNKETIWNVICSYFKEKIFKDNQFMKKVTYLDLKILAKTLSKRIKSIK